MKNGWKEVSTTNERSVYLSLLDDFCPSNDQNECQFVEADPEDIVHILWVQGEAAGFSTLKPKVLHKFLLSNPQYRNQLWAIQFCGGEGERELIWYLIRRRNLANTAEP
uniref:Uncharacterized protein n=1 Tax=Cacopsylla melanoneura TaxID=428564 RepID=A0A8D8XC51_9HEMI